jgi:hypothetical protein
MEVFRKMMAGLAELQTVPYADPLISPKLLAERPAPQDASKADSQMLPQETDSPPEE